MMVLRRLRYVLPLLVFLGLAYFLWMGIGKDPKALPSALLNEQTPAFNLPTVLHPNQKLDNSQFIGKVSLLNVWATWCITCHVEHPALMDIAESHRVQVIGLNYKDNLAKAQKWLDTYGNPYELSGFDKQGSVGIDFGVYGTPETFIIDKKGIIRYRYIGAINHEVWNKTLKPIVEQLEQA